MTYRIGGHIQSGYEGNLGHLAAYVLVDCSPEYVCDVRGAVGPEPWIVVRWAEDGEPVLVSPKAEALDWFGKRLPAMSHYKHPRTLTQGPNEVHRDQRFALAEYELERQRLMQDEGLAGGYVGCSTGQYEVWDWPVFAELFRRFGPGDHLITHEYWKDEADLANTWHVYRWQHMPALAGVPIIVGEIGRDVTEIGGEAGWRLTCSEDQILREVRRYGEGLRRWPNVHGAAVFTMGRIWFKWRNFDSNVLMPRTIAEDEPREETVTETKLIMPMKNIQEAWYAADSLFGPYDDHPTHAMDWNLETGGNSDLGEPLVAPTQVYVVDILPPFGKVGKVLSVAGFVDGLLVNWQWRHLQSIAVKQWQVLAQGDATATLGNAEGQYSAHLHEQICVGAIAPIGTDWRDTRFNWVCPSEFYAKHGVDPALVARLYKWNGA